MPRTPKLTPKITSPKDWSGLRAKRGPHAPKTRTHLAYFEVEVQRFPNGVLSKLPIKRKEIRLMNRGKDYRGREDYNRNTSACQRAKSFKTALGIFRMAGA